MPLSFQQLPGRGQCGGLPRPRGALHQSQQARPSQRRCHRLLGGIQLLGCLYPTGHVWGRAGGTGRCVGGPGDQTGREFALNGQNLRRG